MSKRKGKTRSIIDAIWHYLIIDGLLGLLKLLWHGIAWVGRGIGKVVSETMDSTS